MEQLFRTYKLCAVFRDTPQEYFPDYVQAAYDGGVRIFEVAMNGAGAAAQISYLHDTYGDSVHVGAGTSITLERCRDAKAAGADFLLTPSTFRTILDFAAENSMPILPGVMSPTDVSVCLEYGIKTLKLFPAGDLPPHFIKSLKGPFDGTEYVAVGGVRPDNAPEFLRRGFIGVGIGGNLLPKEVVQGRRWDQARTLIGQLADSMNAVEG